MSDSFTLDLQKFAAKAGKRVDDAVGRIVFGLAAEVDRTSPVGDAKYWKNPPPKGYVGGHFRANWQLGVTSVPRGEVTGVDPGGERTLARISATIPEKAGGKVYYLANNVPYAMRLEYGWSRQAPQGVAGLAAEKFQSIANDAAEKAKAAHP